VFTVAVYHGNDLRKISGGRKGRHIKVKRKYWMGRFPTETRIGEQTIVRKIRVRGGNLKLRVKVASFANVIVPGEGTKKVKIVKLISNPASKDYERRGIITKGAIILTELGPAKVVSRPGQDGVVNAVLIKEAE